jgi:hypothetical protein
MFAMAGSELEARRGGAATDQQVGARQVSHMPSGRALHLMSPRCRPKSRGLACTLSPRRNQSVPELIVACMVLRQCRTDNLTMPPGGMRPMPGCRPLGAPYTNLTIQGAYSCRPLNSIHWSTKKTISPIIGHRPFRT